MQDEINKLKEDYQEHIKQCEVAGLYPLDYGEWVEQVAIAALVKVSLLADELCDYQHAAQVVHEQYETERQKRETFESTLTSVRFLLVTGQFETARQIIGHQMVWN